jgi:hypothetical protein
VPRIHRLHHEAAEFVSRYLVDVNDVERQTTKAIFHDALGLGATLMSQRGFDEGAI